MPDLSQGHLKLHLQKTTSPIHFFTPVCYFDQKRGNGLIDKCVRHPATQNATALKKIDLDFASYHHHTEPDGD
jgi:hypothetical protein